MNFNRKVLLSTSMVLILGITTSCMIGGKLKKNHLANHPSGESVKLFLHNDDEYGGEMLGVDSEFLFLIMKEEGTNQIMKVSWNHLKTIRIGKSLWRIPVPITSDRISQISMRSRYPQGITDMLLADLLNVYGLHEVEVLSM